MDLGASLDAVEEKSLASASNRTLDPVYISHISCVTCIFSFGSGLTHDLVSTPLYPPCFLPVAAGMLQSSLLNAYNLTGHIGASYEHIVCH
jgi:hypothetical protein